MSSACVVGANTELAATLTLLNASYVILVMLPLNVGLIFVIFFSFAVLYVTFPKLTDSSKILSLL